MGAAQRETTALRVKGLFKERMEEYFSCPSEPALPILRNVTARSAASGLGRFVSVNIETRRSVWLFVAAMYPLPDSVACFSPNSFCRTTNV